MSLEMQAGASPRWALWDKLGSWDLISLARGGHEGQRDRSRAGLSKSQGPLS